MLVRVAKNIQQFPAHVVPILTSVVIECQRAKMIGESYQYACTLMKPEYRKDAGWLGKIEVTTEVSPFRCRSEVYWHVLM
jgi:WD repeat-containing protein 19